MATFEKHSNVKHTAAAEIPDPSFLGQAKRRIQADAAVLPEKLKGSGTIALYALAIIGFAVGLLALKEKYFT